MAMGPTQKAKRERRLENVLVENDDIIPLLNNVSLGDPNSSPRHSVDVRHLPVSMCGHPTITADSAIVVRVHAQGGDEEEGHDESEVHVTGAGVLVDWRARYKATYDVPKGERKRDTIVVRLDNTVFTAAGALDPPVTGEVSPLLLLLLLVCVALRPSRTLTPPRTHRWS